MLLMPLKPQTKAYRKAQHGKQLKFEQCLRMHLFVNATSAMPSQVAGTLQRLL